MTSNGESNRLIEAHSGGFTKNYASAAPAIDRNTGQVMFHTAQMVSGRVTLKFLLTDLSPENGLQPVKESSLTRERQVLFEHLDASTASNAASERDGVNLGPGTMDGPELYLPYKIEIENKLAGTGGKAGRLPPRLYNNGVLHSGDRGQTWQMERISTFESGTAVIRDTAAYHYYISQSPGSLSHSRMPRNGGAWTSLVDIIKTVRTFETVAEGDTIHLCWLDDRHFKNEFRLDSPPPVNLQVAYCHRQDAAGQWSEQIMLSKDMEFAYTPSISAEGQNVIVVWTGAMAENNSPVDIYYTTSQNGGKTWAKTVRLTNNKEAIHIPENPVVVIHRGTVHLFYAQGEKLKKTLGYTQFPSTWPIYYRQMPFPKG
jgi:hypothetical protein